MAIPVEFDVSVSDVDGESAWLPLNRWGSSTFRITASITSGSPVFDIVGTQNNILRDVAPASAEEIVLANWDDITAGKTEVQDVLYRALKVKVSSGPGTVRVRIQSEGDC